ncbi:MAG TPA: 50S ribosomal protein L21 [Planctomycetota bacterium]|nr:50S ribosomal protein L21 [Planctomycetota bacterium]
MQAIINDRGRQYLVDAGQSLLVDLLAGAEPGSDHVFDRVLVSGDRIGAPYVDGATVTARVEAHVKGTKLYIQKFKRRKDYRRRFGHRQRYTRVTITAIS